MLAIRMRRVGAKKRPFFRVVVTEQRTSRDGAFVEILGHYYPRTEARQGRDRPRPGAVLDREGRAAVRHGAHADRAAPAGAGGAPAAAAE